jgi:putative membrane protein
MKKINSILIMAMSVFVFQSCQNKPKDSTANADSVNKTKDTTTNAAATGGIAVDKDDAKFAVEAANGGMGEVNMGKIAQQNAANQRVKNFGAMMVSDHSKANDELKALAKTKNITLPLAVNADEQKMEDDLGKKTGKDFDKAYVDGMVKDHKDDIKAFEDAAKNCKDPDLKAFAAKTLPTLKMHLDSIKAIKASMK